VVIAQITGASATNTVTFAATGNPATLDANGGQNALVLRAGWLRFTNLKITNFTGYGIYLDGRTSGAVANDNVFTNVESLGPTSGSTSVRAAYLEAAHRNVFNHCQFRCGGCAVWHSVSNGNTYESCEMDGMNQAQWVGFFINNNDSDNIIQNCFIHSTSTSTSAVALHMQASSFGNMIWNNTILCNTAGAAMMMGGNSQRWASACGLKNNIIVNLGTGILINYWFWNTHTPPPPHHITPCVSDYNCWYCPQNPTSWLLVRGFSPQTVMFQGNLTGFLAWQKNNPGVVYTGGLAVYDGNSIETNPGLVSMTAPFDIHLKSGSPCINRGTSKYPEAYQSINQNLTVTHDFEGDPRGTLVDIGADQVAVSLIGSGSGQRGTPIVFSLAAAADAGLPYQMGSSLGSGPIPLGNRQIGLSPDDLLVVSVGGFLPMIFQGYAGVLDAKGQASAQLNIPNIAALKGVRIHTAFVTLKATAPFGVSNISNTFLFTVQ
jgi:hypothetical protein